MRIIAFVIFISCWCTRHVSPPPHPTFSPDKMHSLGRWKSGQERRYVPAGDLPWSFSSREENGDTNVTAVQVSHLRGLATPRSHGPHGLPEGHFESFHSIWDLNFATLYHGSEVIEALIYQCVFVCVCFLLLHSYTLTLEQHGFELCKSIYMPVFFNTVSPLYSWVLNPRLQLTVDKR